MRVRSWVARTLALCTFASSSLQAQSSSLPDQEPRPSVDAYIEHVLEMPDAQGSALRTRLNRGKDYPFDPRRQVALLYQAQVPFTKVQDWIHLYDAGPLHDDIFLRIASLATRPSLESCLTQQTGQPDALGKPLSSDTAYRYCVTGVREGELGPDSLENRALVLLSYSDFNGATEVEKFSHLLDAVRQHYQLSYFVAQSSAEVNAVLQLHHGGPRIIVGHPRRNGVELMRGTAGGIYYGAHNLAANMFDETVIVYGCNLGNVLAPAVAEHGAHAIGALRSFDASEVRVVHAHPLVLQFTVDGVDATYDSKDSGG